MKMKCTRCDIIGDCPTLMSTKFRSSHEDVVLSIMLPIGWDVQTQMRGGRVEFEVICVRCILKAAHHESWKDGIIP
jgi:hypothetical protein